MSLQLSAIPGPDWSTHFELPPVLLFLINNQSLHQHEETTQIALLTTSCAASPKESVILNLKRPKLSKSLDSLATNMVATQKLYPRGTVKRIVKAHAGRSISKNADVLVCPSYSHRDIKSL